MNQTYIAKQSFLEYKLCLQFSSRKQTLHTDWLNPQAKRITLVSIHLCTSSNVEWHNTEENLWRWEKTSKLKATNKCEFKYLTSWFHTFFNKALMTKSASYFSSSFGLSNTNPTYKSLMAITTVVISGPMIAPCIMMEKFLRTSFSCKVPITCLNLKTYTC